MLPLNVITLLAREHLGSPQYAQKLVSSPCKFDGLYWPAQQSPVASPIGPEMAAAKTEGYKMAGAGRPYHGFLSHSAPRPRGEGGERDYVIGGRMIGGFAFAGVACQLWQQRVMSLWLIRMAWVSTRSRPETAL